MAAHASTAADVRCGRWATPSAPPCRGPAHTAAGSARDRGGHKPIRPVTATLPQVRAVWATANRRHPGPSGR
jgi:hypothetical protein